MMMDFNGLKSTEIEASLLHILDNFGLKIYFNMSLYQIEFYQNFWQRNKDFGGKNIIFNKSK